MIPGFLGPPGPEEPLEMAGNTVGDIFYGSKGYMAVTNEEDYQGYRTWLGKEQQPGPSSSKRGNNWENFINCVRSRRKQDLNAPIQEAHISCTLLHLANASYRLGRTLQFDPAAEHVVGDEEANRLLRGAHREPFVIPENV